jgi:hypothetical protein
MKVRKKTVDIRYSICKCANCEVVRQCTPDFDFYKTELFPGRLLCENCFKEIVLNNEGLKNEISQRENTNRLGHIGKIS